MTAPNIEATVRRWSTPGTWLLLGLAIAYFGPGVWDRFIRARPWITAEIAVEAAPDGATIIRSTTHAAYRVAGRRLLWIEDAGGETICTAQRADAWQGERERAWTFDAFMEHRCAPPPAPWRLCSEFAVQTDLGTGGTFGPYCSPMVEPPPKG